MAALTNFRDKTVLLLGGGPSLRFLLDGIEERLPLDDNYRIVAINDAIYVALYADMLFFRDISWFFSNRKIVEEWNGEIVSSTPSRFYPYKTVWNKDSQCQKIEKINVVKTVHSNDFLVGNDCIRYGRSSGHLALSLAINLGAKRCILLGYDCRVVKGRSHFHDKPSNAFSMTYSHDFLPAWNGWGEAARRAGIEVWNATLNSAILEFEYVPISKVFTQMTNQ